MSTRSSVSTACSDSGDDDSAGRTTTGLMCSDRAEARKKLGGFCKKHNLNQKYNKYKICYLKCRKYMWKTDLKSSSPTSEELVIILFFNLIMCPHLRQLWNLNQPLEILQITGAIE